MMEDERKSAPRADFKVGFVTPLAISPPHGRHYRAWKTLRGETKWGAARAC